MENLIEEIENCIQQTDSIIGTLAELRFYMLAIIFVNFFFVGAILGVLYYLLK